MIGSFPAKHSTHLMGMYIYAKPKEEIAITKFSEVKKVASNHNGLANKIKNAFLIAKGLSTARF